MIDSFGLNTCNRLFQGRDPIHLSIQSGVRLTKVFNNRNQLNTTDFSVRVRLIEVLADLEFIIREI